MKKIKQMLLVTGLMAFFMTAGNAQAVAENYAFVDVAVVFDGYEKTKENDKKLQAEGEEKEREREQYVQEIRALKDELVLLSDDAKAKKQEMLDEKVRQLQDFDRDTKRDLAAKRNKLVREIFQDIDTVIQRYGERKGLDLIFNERALLYHSGALDVTQEVLKELNKEYQGS